MPQIIGPIHPGEHLAEVLEDFGLSQYALAKAMNVPALRISQIVHGKRSITADTSIRLGHVFGQSPRFWLNLQTDYDIEVAQGKFRDDLRKIEIAG